MKMVDKIVLDTELMDEVCLEKRRAARRAHEEGARPTLL